MNKTGEWTEKVHIVKQNLKIFDLVNTDGELVELHSQTKDLLAMEIVNYAEQLNNIDDKSKGSKDGVELRKSNDLFKQAIDEYCGNFYFIFYNRLLSKGVSPQYIFRFLYLCVYMDYENRLTIKKDKIKHLIYESDLQDILKLGRTETYKTKTELIKKELITINEDGIIEINKIYCKKGTILKNKKVGKARMFDDAIKEIYEKSTPKEHKKLALFIELLKYCNLKYNMIAKDTHEQNIDCIKPYSLKELCILLNQSNVTKFKNDLLSLSINGEPVIAFHETKQAKIITVNPRLFYMGTTIEELDWLINMFKVKS
jgi:hypothetical protein